MNLYYKDERLSQSRLKRILMHPRAFLRSEEYRSELPNEKTIIGNLVDLYLTRKEDFSKEFKIIDQKPTLTPQLQSFAEYLFSSRNELLLGLTEDEWTRNAFDKVNSKIGKYEDWVKSLENGPIRLYYDYLIESSGEYQIIDSQINNTALEMVSAFKNDIFTAEYFNYPDTEFQVVIFWDYRNFEMKSMLDLVLVNHEKKQVRGVDIKTTEKLSQFPIVFKKHRYDFQAVTYNKALQSKYPDYEILPFTFLVQSTTYPGNPVIYRLKEETLEKAKTDFEDAITRLHFHSINDLWDHPMEYYENRFLEI